MFQGKVYVTKCGKIIILCGLDTHSEFKIIFFFLGWQVLFYIENSILYGHDVEMIFTNRCIKQFRFDWILYYFIDVFETYWFLKTLILIRNAITIYIIK